MLLEKGKFAQAFALSLKTLSITKLWNDSLSYFIHGESCANNCLFCGVVLHNVDFSCIRITIYCFIEVSGTASESSYLRKRPKVYM